MRIYKWVTLGVAIVIIALEAFLFSQVSTDDIAPPGASATPAVATSGSGDAK